MINHEGNKGIMIRQSKYKQQHPRTIPKVGKNHGTRKSSRAERPSSSLTFPGEKRQREQRSVGDIFKVKRIVKRPTNSIFSNNKYFVKVFFRVHYNLHFPQLMQAGTGSQVMKSHFPQWCLHSQSVAINSSLRCIRLRK